MKILSVEACKEKRKYEEKKKKIALSIVNLGVGAEAGIKRTALEKDIIVKMQ